MGGPAHIGTMTAPDLVITGFEPFPGVAENPTALLVQSLASAHDKALREARHVILPTRYCDAPGRLGEVLDPAPRVLIMTGYSRRAKGPVIETRATNQCAPELVDAGGALPVHGDIDPHHLFGPCDAELLASDLEQAGLSAALSEDAGAYVCNHLYYNALSMLEARRLPTRALFLHLPALVDTPLADASDGAMTLADMQRTLSIIAARLLH